MALLVGDPARPGFSVKNAQRADGNAFGRAQQGPCVEAQAIVSRHERVVGKPVVQPGIGHDEDIILRERMRADRHFERHFAGGKPDLRLEPLPVAGNQVDDRDRHIKCLSGEQHQIVEIRFGRGVENGIAVECRHTLRLAPGRGGGNGAARGIGSHEPPISA